MRARTEGPHDFAGLLTLGTEAARRAGDIHDDGRRMTPEVEEKGSPFDLVTGVDRAAERTIVETIVAARPDDEILGEEGTSRAGTSGVRWIVDPLDGTANYVYGYPAHAVSIGIEVGGTPWVGVVLDTARGVLHSAIRGAGATANGEPIAVTERSDVATAMLATGFSFDPGLRDVQGQVLSRLLPGVRDVRRSGAASTDLCAVAAGAVDAYYEAGLAPWDVAGGIVVAEAAGATVLRGTAEGYPGVSVIAANHRLLTALLPVLNEAGFRLAAGDETQVTPPAG